MIVTFLPIEDKNSVSLVCKSTRRIVNLQKMSCCLQSSFLNAPHCCLRETINLEKVEISAAYDHNPSEKCIIDFLKTADLPKLTHLVMKCFTFTAFDKLVSSLLCLPALNTIECTYCSPIRLQELQNILVSLPCLRFCCIDVCLENTAAKQQFAALADRMARRVNLSLNSLSVSRNYLKYPWETYRCRYPAGQVNE